jgi:hypothetical protein
MSSSHAIDHEDRRAEEQPDPLHRPELAPHAEQHGAHEQQQGEKQHGASGSIAMVLPPQR